MIVKVQRPVMGDGPWLIHDETEEHVWQMPTAEVTRAARAQMGRSLKRYFEVEVDGPDVLILHRVEDQDW